MAESAPNNNDVTVLKIVPSECELCDVKTNIPCPISSCSGIFKSSSNLTMHLEKYHKITDRSQKSLEKKNDNIVYQYYCPIKCCQYHNDFKSTRKKMFFHQFKYLKQHFLKVHSEKRFTCVDCDKSFSVESALKRHQTECGIEYKCSCGQVYLSKHNLLLHATRKKHDVDDKYKSNKLSSVPVSKTVTFMPITVLKPVLPLVTTQSFPTSINFCEISGQEVISPEFSEPLSNNLKKKHFTRILKKQTDLSSMMKRKIVLKKFENAQKLVKLKDASLKLSEFSTISNVEHENNNLEKCVDSVCYMSQKVDKSAINVDSKDNFILTDNSVKISEMCFENSSVKPVGNDVNDSAMIFSHPDVNLNELNSSKNNFYSGNIFDNFEFSSSPKLSQSTQTHEGSTLATTQTDFNISFDDSSLCNYYDNFEFSNSPKLSQSTQTFQSFSQISQTDLQSSFADDSSKSFLSDLIGYYDNFESSNSPKLSQSTQTMTQSLCSWSDNVTQTDLDRDLFGDFSVGQFDYYKNDPSFTENISSSKDEIDSNVNSIKFSDVSVENADSRNADASTSTQTLFGGFLDSRKAKFEKSLSDELISCETQTDSSQYLQGAKTQSFSSIQTQTSTSLNYLIDSETQTQEWLNQLINSQTQTYPSNFK